MTSSDLTERPAPAAATPAPARDFIRQIVDEDLAAGRVSRVSTRFPPEPNGYPHIGHAKSISLNFGLAAEYGGICNLRFDDTNPETEDMEYVEAIQRDVRWLGYDWEHRLFFASDSFERMYEWAVQLIRQGQAYVDESSDEEIRRHRGTVEEPGTPTRWRDRPVAESLDRFARMRAGEFPDGSMVLRAKIDLAAANMKMRDPLVYRVRHATHYRQGDAWCIYPMYDYAHPLCDYIEGITHSLCTLEFENNRELYDWFLDQLVPEPHPQQIEFARLNLSSTVVSKRKLLQLVSEGRVTGWDDPRMPTLAGLRRRGVTAAAIRDLCERVGVTKSNSVVDLALFENSIREDLNAAAPRVLCVLRPLAVTLLNWPAAKVDQLEAPYWPHDVPREGARTLPFSANLLIDRDDFREDPPAKFHRLAPGREVRLRYGYVIRCEEVVKDADGEVVELRCSVDLDTRGGNVSGRKVPGTIHWVSAAHALPVEVRLYDRLFGDERPDSHDDDFTAYLNPSSLEVVERALAEPSLASARPGEHYQFERLGYFFVDPADSVVSPAATGEGPPATTAPRLVFNRVVTLKDSWARSAEREAPGPGAPRRAGSARPTEPASAPQKPEPARTRTWSAAERTRLERYAADGLAPNEAELLAAEPELAAIFDAAVALYPQPRSVARWTVNDLRREAKERPLAQLAITAEALATIARLADEGAVSPPTARELFTRVAREGGDPAAIVERENLAQVSDDAALRALVDGVMAAHAEKVSEYRAGKTALLGFFVGQAMKASGGKADPRQVQEQVRAALDG